MSGAVVLALVLASGAQDLANMPKPLQAYHGVTAWASPYFKESCYSESQKARLGEIGVRSVRAYEILIKRYGEEAVENSYAIIMRGAVRRDPPCDLKKQDERIDGFEAAVAALEAELEVK